MKVVILAGGFGTRFKDETKNIPKPLIEIEKKPIIEHVMDRYIKYNFNEFIITCGYKYKVLMDYYRKKANKIIENNDDILKIEYNNSLITFVNTGLNTMTGGRIKRIRKYIKDDYFFITYCDSLCNINIIDLLNFSKKRSSILTITAVHPVERFGILTINNDLITKFSEKKDSRWINGGFMVASKNIFNYINDDESVLEKDVINNLIQKTSVYTYKYDGLWSCMDMSLDKDSMIKLIRSIQ